MVWFLGGGCGWLTTAVTSQTATTGTTYWPDSWNSTHSITSTPAFVTTTITGSTMSLYESPAWINQWIPIPGMRVRQPRRDPQVERTLAQQQAAMGMGHYGGGGMGVMVGNGGGGAGGMAAPAVHTRQSPAARRARDLLLSYLSDDQRRTFEDHGWFIVLGGRSGRRYRISGVSFAGNVALLRADNDNVEATFCGHCDASIPLGDQLLAQKVMLEVDEPAYIALANRRAA